MSSDEPKHKGHVHPYTISDEADTLAGYKEFTNWPKDHEPVKKIVEKILEDSHVTENPDIFDGLMTLCNSTPATSSNLTYEDLKKAMDEFPTMDEESMARQRQVLMNQGRWEHMIACEPRTCGKTQRLRDIFRYMNIGADFDVYSRNVGHGYFDGLSVCGPRFMRLRRRLFKAVMKVYDHTKR